MGSHFTLQAQVLYGHIKVYTYIVRLVCPPAILGRVFIDTLCTVGKATSLSICAEAHHFALFMLYFIYSLKTAAAGKQTVLSDVKPLF